MIELAKRDESFKASPELVSALQSYGSAITLPVHKLLFERGQKARGVYLLRSGSARLWVSRMMDFTVGPGSLLGVPGTLSKGVYSLSAELLEESQVLFVPSDRVTALLTEHPEIGYQLVQLLSREIQSLRHRIEDMNQRETHS